MKPLKPEPIPGYMISAFEGVTSGLLAYQANEWLGKSVIQLSSLGAGFYCGGATVLHTLLMDDFRRPREYLKSKIPATYSNRMTHLAVDAVASGLILGSMAYLAHFSTPYTSEDFFYLSCLTEGANIMVNHGIINFLSHLTT